MKMYQMKTKDHLRKTRFSELCLILVLLPVVLIVLNCHSQKNAKSQAKVEEKHPVSEIELSNTFLPYRFKKDKEVKLDVVGEACFKKLISNHYIYLVSSQSENADSFYYKYDLDLRFISESKIPYGEGPMECLSPIIMGGNDDTMLVTDITLMRYYIYSADFKRRQRIACKPRGWDGHGIVYSDRYKILASNYRKFDEIHYKTDTFGVYLRKLIGNHSLKDLEVYQFKWPGTYPPALHDIGTPFHFAMINDCLYILRKDEYRILKYDLSGKLLKELKIKGLRDISYSKKERGKFIDDLNIQKIKSDRFTYPEKLWHANWIFEFDGGIAVGRITDYSSEKKKWGEVDYFDLDLNYLGKFKMPWLNGWSCPSVGATDYYCTYKGGWLFIIETRETVDDEEYWLTRWKITKGDKTNDQR